MGTEKSSLQMVETTGCPHAKWINLDPYFTPYKNSAGGPAEVPPWWSSGKEFTLQCRGHWFNPWSRKIPYAVGQLSPGIATAEPVLRLLRLHTTELVVCNKRAPQWEAHTPQLEKAQMQPWRPSTTKNNSKI